MTFISKAALSHYHHRQCQHMDPQIDGHCSACHDPMTYNPPFNRMGLRTSVKDYPFEGLAYLLLDAKGNLKPDWPKATIHGNR